MEKSLKSKAINIKGKKYVLVADRVLYFNETYPNGSIDTTLYVKGDFIRVTAVIHPDVENPARYFNGHAESKRGGSGVDTTSPVENCETSAVGRALAMMGIGVLDSIASADEMHSVYPTASQNASKSQVAYLSNLAVKKGKLPDVLVKDEGYDIETLTKAQASKLIEKLSHELGVEHS